MDYRGRRSACFYGEAVCGRRGIPPAQSGTLTEIGPAAVEWQSRNTARQYALQASPGLMRCEASVSR
ncbi:hypothetical protein Rmet_6525 [Cupriavidus metallidurans CH34]|uniref:Uncharacterized protein n=1 Tax=Cupriavidus metallidurans (strain ATCC 43123 / DSM 2839 / NBRC 102507 / CH34) TaxID=266264 RepID=D3DXW2_CUPMC|nr:hypothetical protein Rmet_6525 [Cupriavidus metallidurans CH34]